MKNVTVTLPEDVARWLRIRAAEDDRSVSKWLADLIEAMRRREDEYEIVVTSMIAVAIGPTVRPPTREDHDRADLR